MSSTIDAITLARFHAALAMDKRGSRHGQNVAFEPGTMSKIPSSESLCGISAKPSLDILEPGSALQDMQETIAYWKSGNPAKLSHCIRLTRSDPAGMIAGYRPRESNVIHLRDFAFSEVTQAAKGITKNRDRMREFAN